MYVCNAIPVFGFPRDHSSRVMRGEEEGFLVLMFPLLVSIPPPSLSSSAA